MNQKKRAGHLYLSSVNRGTLCGMIAQKEARISQLVLALDTKNGTPCEQIRHQQQVDRLTDTLEVLSDSDCYYPHKIAQAALVAFRKAYESQDAADDLSLPGNRKADA